MADEFERRFRQRLVEARKEANLSQEALGKRIGVSTSVVGHWEQGRSQPTAYDIFNLCSALNCSAEWLLTRTPFRDVTHLDKGGGLRWRLLTPHVAQSQTSDEINRGVELFNLIVKEKMGFKELRTRFGAYGEIQLRSFIKLALFSGIIDLVDVERDKEKERLLEKSFPSLHKCFVANTSFQDETLVDAIIRNEAVACLAAHETFQFLPFGETVGLSGGTTLARFVDMLPAASSELRGITWLPLLVSKDPPKRTALSANSVITRLVYKQPGAEAYRLPFIDLPRRSPEYLAQSSGYEKMRIERSQQTLERARNVSAAYLSIGTPEYKFKTTDAYLGLPELMGVFENLSAEDQAKCKGDILLTLVDEDGQRIGTIDDQQANDALVYSIGLDSLRSIATRGTVWILAAKSSKAHVIYGALKAGYANSLVIDGTVADALIRIAAQKSGETKAFS